MRDIPLLLNGIPTLKLDLRAGNPRNKSNLG
nr:MAG TPA: hypothetical protein [Caudoviricetes sp.]